MRRNLYGPGSRALEFNNPEAEERPHYEESTQTGPENQYSGDNNIIPLHPEDAEKRRLAEIGRKKLPQIRRMLEDQ